MSENADAEYAQLIEDFINQMAAVHAPVSDFLSAMNDAMGEIATAITAAEQDFIRQTPASEEG